MNRQAYLSILYTTGGLYLKEAERIEAELAADRGYPIACAHVGPKLEILVAVTKLLLYGKGVFSVGIDADIRRRCRKLLTVVTEGAAPLTERMAKTAKKYSEVEKDDFDGLLKRALDDKPLRVAMRTEFAGFVVSKRKIRRQLSALLKLEPKLAKLKLNPEWVPTKMLSVLSFAQSESLEKTKKRLK
ncbi:MAG: hypothetical protein K1X78_18935 [Verrucomicrobiaceae bacterium]|nr:hypothetical protein [Verrucomicrobiaceae bacterium]